MVNGDISELTPLGTSRLLGFDASSVEAAQTCCGESKTYENQIHCFGEVRSVVFVLF